MALLGWLVLALAVLQLVVLLVHGRRPRRDRATGLQRVLDATALVVLARLVAPWDVVPPLAWCLLVVLLALGALQVARRWGALPGWPPGGRWAAVLGLAVSGALLGVAVTAAGTSVHATLTAVE